MCASDDSVISDLGKGKDLEEAVDIASESTDELAVEYGIWFGEK